MYYVCVRERARSIHRTNGQADKVEADYFHGHHVIDSHACSKALYRWFLAMKQPSGGFSMHEDG